MLLTIGATIRFQLVDQPATKYFVGTAIERIDQIVPAIEPADPVYTIVAREESADAAPLALIVARSSEIVAPGDPRAGSQAVGLHITMPVTITFDAVTEAPTVTVDTAELDAIDPATVRRAVWGTDDDD